MKAYAHSPRNDGWLKIARPILTDLGSIEQPIADICCAYASIFVPRHAKCDQRKVAISSESLQNTIFLNALCLHNSANNKYLKVRVLVSDMADRSLDGSSGVDDGVH